MRRVLFVSMVATTLATARVSLAQDPDAPAEPLPPPAATLPSATPAPPPPDSILPTPPEEAPPPAPRQTGLVAESSIGALAFLGQFRHVAPPALWMRTQVGYEVLKFLMFFASGELIFTDTSEADDPSKARAFPIFAFGGGLRATIRPTDRFAFFVQGNIDAMKADIPKGAFANLGYRDAESLNPSFGGRVGLEWYQVDRHLALSVSSGLRDATGFAKVSEKGAPLMLDGGVTLRYTF